MDGRLTGPAGSLDPDALNALIRFRLTAVDRGLPITVVPPSRLREERAMTDDDPALRATASTRPTTAPGVEGKRDRLARLLSVLRILQAHGDAGISPAEIARRTGMSKRSIYRDLEALQTEMQVPLWSDKGKWGVQPGAFLPPLRLTPARGDGRVPLGAARDPLRGQVRARTSRRRSRSSARRCRTRSASTSSGRWTTSRSGRVDPTSTATSTDLTKRLGGAAGRRASGTSRPATTATEREARTAEVEPYLLEPSLATHALYLIGLDRTRGAIRTFKVERIVDLALTPRRFEAPEAGGPRDDAPAGVGHHRRPARDRGRAALRPVGRRPRRRGDVAPEPGGPRRVPTARSSGARGSPGRSRSGSGSCPGATRWRSSSRPQLRADVAATHARAASRYGEG